MERYTRVPNNMIRNPSLSHYEKVVLICIMSYNPKFPSYTKIGEDLSLSRDRVWKSIKALERDGILIIDRQGRSNLYTIRWDFLEAEYSGAQSGFEFVEELKAGVTPTVRIKSPGKIIHTVGGVIHNGKKPVRHTDYTSPPGGL